MTLRWDAVTLDCRDPKALAEFWCALLRTTVRGSVDQYVGLKPAAPGMPRLILQGVPDHQPGRNSWHLDLHVASVEELPAEVARAQSLGAGIVDKHDDNLGTWVVMADPEGNLFCLVAD